MISPSARSERKTQNRFAALFIDAPGCLGYDRLGKWSKRDKTRNIKQAMMQELLTGKTRLLGDTIQPILEKTP